MKTPSAQLSALWASGAAQGEPSLPADLYQEQYRPQFHFTPLHQWMNDPNGMFYYQGEYHLFYQYHPHSTIWGPMHWGHAVSEDLVHWEHLPIALHPDQLGAIFSGGAVVDWQNSSGFGTEDNPPLVAFYTYQDHTAEESGRNDFQSQAIAYSLDKGRTWTKYAGNPVLPNQGDRDFRDPKVFWYAAQDKWIMTLAVANRVSFYSSTDLKDWKFESDFGEDWGVHAGVWECPDLFEAPIAGKDESRYVLLVSIISGSPNGGTATQYFIGDFDGNRFELDATLQDLKVRPAVFPEGKVFENFEQSLTRWTATEDTVEITSIVAPVQEQTIDGAAALATGVSVAADAGALRSSSFTIDQPFINFYVGSGPNPDTLGMRLIVNGDVVRRAGGSDTLRMQVKSWDVSEFKGQQGCLEIIDRADARWGHVIIDNIVFASQAAQPLQESALWLDYGTDNYAGVTWSDIPTEDGRRLFIGWMSNWDYAIKTPTERWRSAMTVPRTLTLHRIHQGYRVHSQPVQELEKLRAGSTCIENAMVNGSLDLGLALNNTSGTMEILLALDTLDAPTVRLVLANAAEEQTLFTIDRKQGVYALDRTQSGTVDFAETFASVQTAPIVGSASTVSLQVFVDHSSVEVFVNEGETVLTAQVFPGQPYTSVRLESDGTVELESANLYTLRSIWDEA